MDTISPQWSGLPYDLLAMIAKRLHIHGRYCFCAVCHSFRSSIPPSRALSLCLPLKVPPSYLDDDRHLLTESTVYAIIPFNKVDEERETMKTLLIRVEKLNSEKVKVYDTFSDHKYSQIPMSWNLLDLEITEITKAYRILTHHTRSWETYIRVVVSTCLDDIDNSFVVMGLNDDGEVSVWRNGDNEWSDVDTRFGLSYFEDVIYHNKKFYVVDDTGEGFAVTFNSKSFSVVEVASHGLTPPGTADNRYQKGIHLVKSLKLELFLIEIVFEMCGIESLRVFKMDEKKNKWVGVMDDELNDEVLIVGKFSPFSVSSNCVFSEFNDGESLPVPNSNCVYYERSGFDSAIFELKDGIGHRWPGNSMCVFDQTFRSPPTWLNANVVGNESSFLYDHCWN